MTTLQYIKPTKYNSAMFKVIDSNNSKLPIKTYKGQDYIYIKYSRIIALDKLKSNELYTVLFVSRRRFKNKENKEINYIAEITLKKK